MIVNLLLYDISFYITFIFRKTNSENFDSNNEMAVYVFSVSVKRIIHSLRSIKKRNTLSKMGELSLQIPKCFRRMTISWLRQWWFVSLETLAGRVCKQHVLHRHVVVSPQQGIYTCVSSVYVYLQLCGNAFIYMHV